eukprot:gene50905-41305_t
MRAHIHRALPHDSGVPALHHYEITAAHPYCSKPGVAREWAA